MYGFGVNVCVFLRLTKNVYGYGSCTVVENKTYSGIEDLLLGKPMEPNFS